MDSAASSTGQDHLAWRRWLLLMAATIAMTMLAAFAFVVLVDPFSTGRMTAVERIDYVSGNRVYDSVARVRDQRFDAAVIGTSVAVRISPEALSQATGRHFAMLGIEGVWPQEHVYLMRQFDHAHLGAVFTVVLDDLWCSSTLGQGYSLPRWLFDGSDAEYLTRVLSSYSVRVAWRRLLAMSGYATGLRPDGYDPRPWAPPARERMRREMETMSQPVNDVAADAPFPYLSDLQQALDAIDRKAIVLMAFTPVFAKHLPVPGSKADARVRACKARAQAIADARPGSRMLDLRVDGPKARDIDNFVDPMHYKDPIARDIEVAVGQSLNDMLRERGAPPRS
jgi:hypothetical protein